MTPKKTNHDSLQKKRRLTNVNREPYPGFVVHDDRVTGSLTAGHSRLPLWAFMAALIDGGYAQAEKDYSLSHYVTKGTLSDFLTDLFEQRGAFARLLCVLAAAQRKRRLRQNSDTNQPNKLKNRSTSRVHQSWDEDRFSKTQIRAALKICLNDLTLP